MQSALIRLKRWWKGGVMLAATVVLLGAVVDLSLAEGRGQLGTLHWHNRDQLPGILCDANDKTLRWQSPYFATPFTLELSALRAIEYPTPEEPVISEQPFRFVTVTNDVFLGDLVEITDQDVVIRSPRHGELRIKRSHLIGLQRHNRKTAGSVGLGMLSDWKTLHHGRQISEWTRAIDGRIVTEVTGAELYRDLHMGGLSEIELTLSWTGKPGFMISFARPDDVRLSKTVIKLETWENDLVLQTLGANGDFEVIDTIPAKAQTLDLRLQWNPVTGELSVFSSLGRLLGKMKGPTAPTAQLTGLYIQNKGATLKLANLRASGWDETTTELPAGSVRVRTAKQKKALTGVITRVDTAARVLVLKMPANGTQPIPLDDIDSIDLGNEAIPASKSVPTRISFLDGTQITGNLASIQDNVLSMTTSYSDAPVTARTDGLFNIHFAEPQNETKTANLDTLNYEQGRLHGTLVAVAQQGDAAGWRPVGGLNACVLPTDMSFRVTRKLDSADAATPGHRFLDRIFLRNGDALPCSIHGIDSSHLDIVVPHTGRSQIDRNVAVAIELGRRSSSISRSFDDPQWVIKPGRKENVERTGKEMTIRGRATIAYDNIRDADEIAFDVKWNMSTGALIRISLFGDSAGRVGQVSSIMLYRAQGSRVVVQAMGMRGANGMRVQMGMGMRANAQVQTHDGTNSFRFRIYPKKIVVYESGKEVLQFAINRAKITGRELTFDIQPLNVRVGGIGNARVVGAAKAKPVLVTLLNPMVRRGRGDLLNALADEERRNRLLTIPRFRKQSPPTEILVAYNGDLLRGRLMALDDKQVSFVSRLDEITVPRERLAGIIWPQTEQANKETADALQGLMRILFTDGSNIRIKPERIVDDALVGQHPALGKIAIPLSQTRELSMGTLSKMPASRYSESPSISFADWTLRPALEPKFEQATDGKGNGRGGESPLVGKPVPVFNAKLLDDSGFRISMQKGKVIVLDFWATWCGPCVASMPDTAKTVAEFPSDKVMLVAVNQLETADTIRQFIEQRNWDINVALDEDGKIGKLFHVNSIPQLVVIDATGMVQRVFIGAHDDLPEELKQVLTQLTAD